MQELEKILEEIEQEKLKHWDSSERLETDKLMGWCFDRCTDIIRKHIDDAPENGGWIPVEERLPEEDGFYIATIDGEIAGQEESFVGIAEFEDGFWVDDDIDYKCIIAWRPLPEPYRPEGSE